jgi:hypothetical protein
VLWVLLADGERFSRASRYLDAEFTVRTAIDFSRLGRAGGAGDTVAEVCTQVHQGYGKFVRARSHFWFLHRGSPRYMNDDVEVIRLWC